MKMVCAILMFLSMFFIVLAFMVDLKWMFKIVTRKSLWRKSFKRLGVNISSLGDVPEMYQGACG